MCPDALSLEPQKVSLQTVCGEPWLGWPTQIEASLAVSLSIAALAMISRRLSRNGRMPGVRCFSVRDRKLGNTMEVVASWKSFALSKHAQRIRGVFLLVSVGPSV